MIYYRYDADSDCSDHLPTRDHRFGLDLDQHPGLGQGVDTDEGARSKVVAQDLTADVLEISSIPPVRDIHRHPHEVGHRCAGRL